VLRVQITDWCFQAVGEQGNVIKCQLIHCVCLHIPEIYVIVRECVHVCVCVWVRLQSLREKTVTSRDLGDIG